MTEGISAVLRESYQRRKYAPLHWKARAYNAHSVADFLWANSGKGRDIAMNEGYQREAAIALELMIKAVIVARIEAGEASPQDLEESHDLPKLWRNAKLLPLVREDRYRLTYFKSVLLWLGRYPIPKSAEHWQRDIRERDRDASFRRLGSIRVRTSTACGFAEFDQLFQRAAARFEEIVNR